MKYLRFAAAILLVSLSYAELAAAQATRTWVSGVGDDANPCSRTAPCKTFAGAISKTAAGGEISALDPGGYGAVTITKSITISGDGTLASILSSLTTGVIVNAGANDVVTLRNLSINGAGSGVTGIRYIGGRSLIVQNTTLSGFTGNGIEVQLMAKGVLSLSNVSIARANNGIRVISSMQRFDMSASNLQITRMLTNGIDSSAGFLNIRDSLITDAAGIAVLVQGGAITVESSTLSGNGVALQVNAGELRISNNGVYDNQTGFVCMGGTMVTTSDNRKGNNVGGSAPVCTPIMNSINRG